MDECTDTIWHDWNELYMMKIMSERCQEATPEKLCVFGTPVVASIFLFMFRSFVFFFTFYNRVQVVACVSAMPVVLNASS